MPLQEGRVLTSDNKPLPVWIDVEKDQINIVGKLDDSNLLIETQAALRGKDDTEPRGVVSILSTLRVNDEGAPADWPVLLDGQLDILRDARSAALAPKEPAGPDITGEPPVETETVAERPQELPVQAEPQAPQQDDLELYIGSLAKWFAQSFDGYVYDYSSRDEYLPKVLNFTAAEERSHLQGAPRPSWAARVTLVGRDDGVALPGNYFGYFEVDQDYAYLYLSSEEFAQAKKTLEAQAPAVQVPVAQEQPASGQMLSKEKAIEMLIADLKDDTRRAELFWRQGASSHIQDYEIDVADRDSIGQFVGGELDGERGWAMNSDFVIQATMSGGGFGPPTDVTIDGGKLLVTEDNSQIWIQIPDNAL